MFVTSLFGVRMFFVAELRAQQRMLPSGRREAARKPVGAVSQVEPLLSQLQKPTLVAHARRAIGKVNRIGRVGPIFGLFGHLRSGLNSPTLSKDVIVSFFAKPAG